AGLGGGGHPARAPRLPAGAPAAGLVLFVGGGGLRAPGRRPLDGLGNAHLPPLLGSPFQPRLRGGDRSLLHAPAARGCDRRRAPALVVAPLPARRARRQHGLPGRAHREPPPPSAPRGGGLPRRHTGGGLPGAARSDELALRRRAPRRLRGGKDLPRRPSRAGEAPPPAPAASPPPGRKPDR